MHMSIDLANVDFQGQFNQFSLARAPEGERTDQPVRPGRLPIQFSVVLFVPEAVLVLVGWRAS